MSDRVERRLWLEATPEDVWDVITGGSWLADEVVFDLQPGGDALFRSGDSTKTGWIEEACPPASGDRIARLAFWWAADDEPATRVEVTLEPARGWDGPEGTRLRIVESRPLDSLDLIATPLPGAGGTTYGPVLLAA